MLILNTNDYERRIFMQQLFYNGDILTLEDSQPEAILVEDGTIVYCGSLQAAKEKTIPNCDETICMGIA